MFVIRRFELSMVLGLFLVSCAPTGEQDAVSEGAAAIPASCTSNYFPNKLSVLQANVGNVRLIDEGKVLPAEGKLASFDTEAAVRATIHSIQQRMPIDIVFFQELLPDSFCADEKLSGEAPVCQERHMLAALQAQALRLLDYGYTIVCPTYGWDCVAWRSEIGHALPDAEGRTCPPDHICGPAETNFATVPAASLPSAWHAEYHPEQYGDGFQVFYVDIRLHLNGEVLRLTLGHPRSELLFEATGVRTGTQEWLAQVDQVINWNKDADVDLKLLAGDLNYDPSETESPPQPDKIELDYRWQRIEEIFPQNHSQGLGTFSRRYAIVQAPYDTAMDHVRSSLPEGSCEAIDLHPNNLNPYLAPIGRSLDHRALLCQLCY